MDGLDEPSHRFITDEPPTPIELPDYAELEARQKARVVAARASRDTERANRALAAVETAARGSDPLMPGILEAVRARATLGEISDVLRNAWGVYRG